MTANNHGIWSYFLVFQAKPEDKLTLKTEFLQPNPLYFSVLGTRLQNIQSKHPTKVFSRSDDQDSIVFC